MACEDPVLAAGSGPGQARKLFAGGRIRLQHRPEAAEVRRGMPILARDGEALGVVAAVVVDAGTHQATHLLLCHVPPTAEHRLIPLSLVGALEADVVHLRTTPAEVAQLLVYRPAG